MNSKKFSNSLGDIDESYINEAITYKSNKKSKPWIRWVSLAACLCIIASASFTAYKKGWFSTTVGNPTEELTTTVENPNEWSPSAVQIQNLMEGVTPNRVTPLDNLSQNNTSATDFALRLFKQANENGESTLISPLSVLYALAMTVNGAEGETRAQMEKAIGMSAEELNIYLYSYMSALPQGEKYKVGIANSIWISEEKRFSPNQSFLQANADYLGADIYNAKFNEQTLNNINDWVNNKTDGAIPRVLNEISEDAIMYLINALIFEAEWSNEYTKQDVRNGKFTNEDGTTQTVEFMYSTEHSYIEDENATGFIKHYNSAKYAFVALLPNEGVTVSEYLSTLDGKSLSEMLDNKKSTTVKTSIPKFEVEYENDEMSAVLKSMGITDAFDENIANFNGIGKSEMGNIYISRVIHKTYIQVNEIGTKAGAVTSVEFESEGVQEVPDEIKTVYLDRPFVYMIIDCENNIPLFVGTMMGVEG